jgi:hypothetical protein
LSCSSPDDPICLSIMSKYRNFLLYHNLLSTFPLSHCSITNPCPKHKLPLKLTKSIHGISASHWLHMIHDVLRTQSVPPSKTSTFQIENLNHTSKTKCNTWWTTSNASLQWQVSQANL